MLTVWGRRSSFNVQKVMWLIGELALEHRHIPAGGERQARYARVRRDESHAPRAGHR
jgi:hypothetical protein